MPVSTTRSTITMDAKRTFSAGNVVNHYSGTSCMPGRWGGYDWGVVEKQRLEVGSGRNRVNYLLNLSSLPRISGAHVRTEVLQR